MDLLRDEDSGRLFCKSGMCPNGKNRSITDLIDLQVEIRKLRTDLRTQTVDKEKLLAHVENLQGGLAVALDIKEIGSVDPITSSAPGARSESVPILLCTDWHCGAVVKPETVNDLNKYDVDIFHARASTLFPGRKAVSDWLHFLGRQRPRGGAAPVDVHLPSGLPTRRLLTRLLTL